MNLLLVEDEPLQREMLVGHLSLREHRVIAVGSAEEALRELESSRVDVVLTDLRLPGCSGIELLEAARAINPEIAHVVITAYATVEAAVQAMKLGAVDFLTKPLELSALDALLARIAAERKLVEENYWLRRRISELRSDSPLIGDSLALRLVIDLACKVSPTESSVLITGETGCGKELIADLIHDRSKRREGPFVKVNCGALPHELFESELFGHKRGAFTGADKHRPGRVAEADGGTLMLDEIGELPLSAQVKLLRFLQDGVYFPVGSDRPATADVRLIACTNRDLRQMSSAGSFREDLYFRLNVIPIHIPPLRERREDIGPMLDHFVSHFAAKLNMPGKKLSSSARDALVKYRWPGNVRELRNLIERIVLISRGDVIDMLDLPCEVTAISPGRFASPPGSNDLQADLSSLEETRIRAALGLCKWNQTRAAERLGISERVLRYKLKKHGIQRGPHQ